MVISAAYCAEKIVSACYVCSSASAERVGQWEVGDVTRRVQDMHMVAARLGCQVPWLGPGGPIPVLAAWTGLENATLTL